MTFYLIGLGLSEDSISLEAKKIIEMADEIYLENYTVDFPYEKQDLEKSLEKQLITLNREQVEDESVLKNAKSKNVVLLVYGDPFSATTHNQLILSCKKQKIAFEIFHNASVMNAIAETGLSLYKFGKTSSMPTWTESYKPSSFMNYIKQNQEIRAHSLLLIDIGLDFQKALQQLIEASEKEKFILEKIIVCSAIGTNKKKIIFDSFDNLHKIQDVEKPFCFVIPSEMHFMEQEFLEKD